MGSQFSIWMNGEVLWSRFSVCCHICDVTKLAKCNWNLFDGSTFIWLISVPTSVNSYRRVVHSRVQIRVQSWIGYTCPVATKQNFLNLWWCQCGQKYEVNSIALRAGTVRNIVLMFSWRTVDLEQHQWGRSSQQYLTARTRWDNWEGFRTRNYIFLWNLFCFVLQ